MESLRSSAAAAFMALALCGVSCRRGPSVDIKQPLESGQRYTCCNLHYQSEDVNDANYWIGTSLPAGTPVKIEKLGRDSVTFRAGDVRLTLTHQYGGEQESLQQYLDKVLIKTDPRPRIAVYSSAVRRAIANAKVERGMSREQVVTSLGYPPTNRTPSTHEREWTYWYNRWVTYKVVFDVPGRVSDIIGHPAPTAEVAIPNADRVAPTRNPSAGHGKRRR